MLIKRLLLFSVFLFSGSAFAQTHLTLQEAVATAVNNYGTIQAKAAYAQASTQRAQQAVMEYFPNLNFGAQNAYGTVNGLNGPLYAFPNINSVTAGLPTPQQNWNAAFGSLYLTNVNWDFFAFGRAHERIRSAQASARRDQRDYEQELFQHKIRVAGAYLNLVAAHQLIASYQRNLSRADTLNLVVTARAINGLIAGVDSSQSDAERSAAQIALTKAIDAAQEQGNQLCRLMGVPAQEFSLDTTFVARVPSSLQASHNDTSISNHPMLRWYESRVAQSNRDAAYYRTFYFPTLSLVGVLQTRGSGFGTTYASNLTDYTNDYFTGVNPTRANYLLGIGATWNFTQLLRVSHQVRAQRLTSVGLQAEYNLAAQQLTAQLALSDTKIRNALSNYYEAPIQVRAASNAYLQRSVLYRNGLTDIVDVSQAAYILIRAETDRDIANNNVWQALLLRAAAAGDFSLFESQLQ